MTDPNSGKQIRFSKTAKQNLGKRFTDRYRWTDTEKLQALSELNSDPTIALPPLPVIMPADTYEPVSFFGLTGQYTTGFPALDRLTLGINPGDYIVLGGGTNQGKSQLATYIASHTAAANIPTLYISRELSNAEMTGRFKHIMGLGQTDELGLPALNFPDDNRLSAADLERTIINFRDTFIGEDQKGLIIIDHIHAFCRGANLTEQLGELSAHLRELAQDYQIPIMALSQFNRQPYSQDTGPSNYHLKESGYLEDDAYTILLAWRVGTKLNVRLTKARNLDLGSIADPVVSLTATADGRLTDPTTKPWVPHA